MRHVTALFLALLSACAAGSTSSSTSSSGGVADAGHDPNVDFIVDGCEHMNNGPDLGTVTATIVAGATDGGSVGTLVVEHGRTTVNLVDFQAMKGGHLRFDWNPAATDSVLWIVMEQENVPLELRSSAGSVINPTVDLPRGQLPGNCGSEPRRAGHLWVFEGLAAGTYDMVLGPTSHATVAVVAIDSGEAE